MTESKTQNSRYNKKTQSKHTHERERGDAYLEE
jgi:hypothetical protein